MTITKREGRAIRARRRLSRQNGRLDKIPELGRLKTGGKGRYNTPYRGRVPRVSRIQFFAPCGMAVPQGATFNYSAAAVEKNAENVLVIWTAPELAAQYAHEWNRFWKEGEAAKTNY